MKIEKVSPIKLLLPQGLEGRIYLDKLRKTLGYEDKRVTYELLTWKKVKAKDDAWLLLTREKQQQQLRHWFPAKFGSVALDEKIKELDKARFKSCLFQEDGKYYTYTGLQGIVERATGLETLTTYKKLTPDDWKPLPWATQPHEPRWYQTKTLDLLVPEDGSRMHGAAELGTGLGKTLILAMVLRRIGLSAVVVTPTLSIAEQALADFSRWFGKSKVSQFFGGKKKSDKLITVAVAKSLANVVKGDPHYDNLFNKKVLLVDETHLAPPDSLSTVIFGLLSNCQYRYFFSGTVLRNDGLDLLLDAITGDIVFRMSVEQGIKEKYLAPLKFFQYRIKADSDKKIEDPIKATRVHLHQNKNVYKHVANLINCAVAQKNRKVLVLVDTVDQYKYLLDAGLTVPSKFAHGPLSADNRDSVPQDQWKLDPMDLVAEFDEFKFPVLVATGCVSIGTDIKYADLLVNIVGLASEIEIRQGVGRGTRLPVGKTDCIYVDYNVIQSDEDDKLWTLSRHAAKRREIFNNIYGECRVLDAKI